MGQSLGLTTLLIRTLAALAAVAAVAASPAHAADGDKRGGSDHPLISRYAGSTLYLYGDENLGQTKVFEESKGKPVVSTIEGKISNKVYWAPKGRSPLEVYRNYQQALQGAGFTTLYSCEAAACERARTQSKMTRWVQNMHWIEDGKGDPFLTRMFEYKPGFHYLHARKQGASGNVNVQIALRAPDEDGNAAGQVQQFVQVVEAANISQGQVTVDAAFIGSALKRDGRVALYGVLFDTNEARIKSASADTLKQMAATLKNEPALKVFIVGHTDDQGAVDSNLALSKRRAQAVAETLSKDYGIAPARLLAHGVANLAPAASNADAAGRTRNRRVEMVVR